MLINLINPKRVLYDSLILSIVLEEFNSLDYNNKSMEQDLERSDKSSTVK